MICPRCNLEIDYNGQHYTIDGHCPQEYFYSYPNVNILPNPNPDCFPNPIVKVSDLQELKDRLKNIEESLDWIKKRLS